MRSSLLEHLEYFSRFAGETAFVQQRGLRRERWSYQDVLDYAWDFAAELRSRGISPGAHVLLWGADSAEWVGAFLGCITQGVVAVPLDRAGTAEFAARVFSQLNAALVCGDRMILEGARLGPKLAFVDVRRGSATAALPRQPAELNRESVLQVLFTSGTTAEPRGVVMTHGNVLANLGPIEREIEKYRRYERPFHPLRFLQTVPLSHVFGQMMGIFIPPLLGATVVFAEGLNAETLNTTIRRERVSVLVATPRVVETVQSRLERAHHITAQELERAAQSHFLKRWWRFRRVHRAMGWKFWAIVCGGAALEPGAEEFWRRLGYVVLQGYGLTESTSLVSMNHPFRRGAGSVGKVLPGREMKLAPDGEILVRGENIASRYWQAGRLLPIAGDEGWFHTGDLGELDAGGHLHFKGRKKSVIVTPEGLNVYPADVERALRTQPGMRDVVVFGRTRGGNAEVAAVLLLGGGTDAEAAVRAANEQLAPYQRIRWWSVWPEPDFPRTATQKPKLAEIEARAFAARETAQSVAAKDAGPVAEALRRLRGGEERNLSAETRLDQDLGLSSIERVELMCALEEKYNLRLDESTFAEARTVEEVEQLLATPESDLTSNEYPNPKWALRAPVRWLRLAVYYLLTWPATRVLAKPRVEYAPGAREQLRQLTGPVLVIANHVTYIDAGLILFALPKRWRHRMAIAMRGELLREMRHPPRDGPLLERAAYAAGYWLVTALFNVFPLPQYSGFRQSFSYAGEAADRGWSVLVFPEGSRTQNGEIGGFRSGTGLLAQQLRLPVVPVRIHGLFAAKQRHRRGWLHGLWLKRGELRMVIGEPWMAGRDEGQSPEQTAAELERRVREL